MPLFTKESLERLRHRIDLAEVLSTHIELKRTGASYKALCPFHEEKTPSFVLQKGDSHYHCFGCGAHGDAIQFLMNYLSLNFAEAVETLAEKFNVPLEMAEQEENPGVGKTFLKQSLEMASEFYHKTLLESEEGRAARHYLNERGLSDDFIRRFEVGLAPAFSSTFHQLMRHHKIHQQTLLEAGLIGAERKNPFFRDRITFPIRNPAGTIIGFSARKYKEETFGGKYINTPETALFKKSRILFGLNYCRRRIAKERRAIIVEGQIDCLKLIEAGLNCTVASLGTALGESHVKELQNLGVRRVYLLFDSDDAGESAASKAGNLFQKLGIEVTVVTLPKGSDPDTYLVQFGPQKLIELIKSGVDYLTFQVDYLSREYHPSTPAGKNALVTALTQQVKSWEQPVMVHESLRRVASLTHVPEETLGISGGYTPQPYLRQASATTGSIDPNRVLELDLLRWLILHERKSFVEIAKKELKPHFFWVPICRQLFAITSTCLTVMPLLYPM
nr:DNA primase [Chlamydiota bacterium]